MKEPRRITNKLWELIALVILGSIALQYAIGVLTPLVPVIVGLLAFLFIGGYVIHRLRRW